MKILSIDFDYFFPNDCWYDWGHNENYSIFFESIWKFRVNDIHLRTRESVLDVFVPTISHDFWSLITNKPDLYIAESHSSIWPFIAKYKPATIYSLDAHHDCGYNVLTHIDCSNWGVHALISGSRLHIIYPAWRKEELENAPSQKPTSINYTLPDPQGYDIVFICRSGCWIPTWTDHFFQEFVIDSKLKYTKLDKLVWLMRRPNLTEAEIIRKQSFKGKLCHISNWTRTICNLQMQKCLQALQHWEESE
jgi:hypothetical protein